MNKYTQLIDPSGQPGHSCGDFVTPKQLESGIRNAMPLIHPWVKQTSMIDVTLSFPITLRYHILEHQGQNTSPALLSAVEPSDIFLVQNKDLRKNKGHCHLDSGDAMITSG